MTTHRMTIMLAAAEAGRAAGLEGIGAIASHNGPSREDVLSTIRDMATDDAPDTAVLGEWEAHRVNATRPGHTDPIDTDAPSPGALAFAAGVALARADFKGGRTTPRNLEVWADNEDMTQLPDLMDECGVSYPANLNEATPDEIDSIDEVADSFEEGYAEGWNTHAAGGAE